MTKEQQPKVYFGREKTKKFYLPDTNEEQWIEHKKLNEGQRRIYEDTTSRKVSMDRSLNSIEMDMKVGEDRKSLFDIAAIGYKLLVEDDAGNIKEYSEYNKSDWDMISGKMDADVAQLLLKDIQEFNPWLLGETETGKKK